MAWQDVEPDRKGWIKKIIRELRGTTTDFIKEAVVNSAEYKPQLAKPTITIGIIPFDETRSIVYVTDDSDGIKDEFWLDYRTRLNKHVNPKGKLGIFGEGGRKSGLSASAEEPRCLFTRTKAIGENEKYATFLLTSEEGKEAFQCSPSSQNIPIWVKPFLEKMPIGEHGTQQFILTRNPDYDSIKTVMQNFSALALRRGEINLNLILHKPNSLTIEKQDKLTAPTYNAQRIENFDIYGKGFKFPCIAHIGTSVSDHFKNLKRDDIIHVSDTVFFVSGFKVKTQRVRRDDVIVEVDMTDSIEFRTGIVGNKDDVTADVGEMFCEPIEGKIRERYKSRQERTKDKTAEKITNNILERLIKKFKNFGKEIEVGESEDGEIIRSPPHPRYMYIFKCNLCGYKWHAYTLTVECPQCHSKNIEYQQLPRPPSNPNLNSNPNSKPRKPKRKKGRGKGKRARTNIIISHVPNGGKTFVEFSYPYITFDTDHILHKKCDTYTTTRAEEVYKPFISLILGLWYDPKLRYDENQKEMLARQLHQLADDYVL